MAEGYNEAYARVGGLFGGGPEETLIRFADHLDRRRPVLDVGCGQGRNSFWLAAKGLDVIALDPCKEATRQATAAARERGLAVDVHHGGYGDFRPPEGSFGGICVFGLMQILTRADIENLVSLINSWTAAGSMLFVTAWTVEDPCFAAIAEQWRPIGVLSFVHEDGRVRTFFRRGEILDLFADWQVVFHWEGLGPWHSHGDGPEERHGVVELVARRVGR